MARDTLSERVERLEFTVQGLEGLPGEVAGLRRDVASLGDRMTGVETQILQFRTEMRADFSAVRGELGNKIDENWNRTLVLHEHLIAQIKTIGEHGNGKPPSGASGTSKRKR